MNERRCAILGAGSDADLCRLCRKALGKLEKAAGLAPQELTDEIDIAENAVVGLRDILIDRYRQAESPSEAEQFMGFLTCVNTVLSMIAGVVYPVAGIQRASIEKARNLLKDVTSPCF